MAISCDLAVVQSNYFGSVPKPTESLERHVIWCNFISFQINLKLAYTILHLGWFCILHSFLNINHLHDLLHPHNWPKLVNICWLVERERERWASPPLLLISMANILPVFVHVYFALLVQWMEQLVQASFHCDKCRKSTWLQWSWIRPITFFSTRQLWK